MEENPESNMDLSAEALVPLFEMMESDYVDVRNEGMAGLASVALFQPCNNETVCRAVIKLINRDPSHLYGAPLYVLTALDCQLPIPDSCQFIRNLPESYRTRQLKKMALTLLKIN